MTLRDEYFRYLDHFSRTITLREMHAQPQAPDVIALRHDIDHDLDLALETAHHEHARGMRATYFLLHTHSYWHDAQFAAKCAQLQAYGHEVGLHLNALVQWIRAECEDIDGALAAALKHLRQRNVKVSGVSAHGDKACYEHQIINYWLFSELRGKDPHNTEHGRSAEGVVVDDPQWQIRYPANHSLTRADGRTLALWSSSLQRHGLDYEAMHVKVDRYWTDSGGNWARSGDPLQTDLARGRHQILMHPWWWRGSRKTIFVLSAARSGSAWLASFVDRATSCRGLHEFTLNHHRDGDKIVSDKRTGDGFLDLVERPNDASVLIRHALAAFKLGGRDMLEANVYLEPFLARLQKIAPEATIIHLHRDGRDVVRSILNRGWYATPIDRRHRAAPIPNWDSLTQFERACCYWRFTNQRMMSLNVRLSFERMVSDLDYLKEFFKELGIIVHPVLAAEEFGRRVNVNAHHEVPRFEDWPRRLQRRFGLICGSTQRALGYACAVSDDIKSMSRLRGPLQYGQLEILHVNVLDQPGVTFNGHDVTVTRLNGGMLRLDPGRAASGGHAVLARGTWHSVARADGIRCRRRVYFVGRIVADIPAHATARVYGLFFDAGGKQIGKTQVATIRAPLVAKTDAPVADASTNGEVAQAGAESSDGRVEFAVASPRQASHMALAIMLDAIPKGGGGGVLLRSVALSLRRLERGYATPRFTLAIARRAVDRLLRQLDLRRRWPLRTRGR